MRYDLNIERDETENGEPSLLVTCPQFSEITTFGDSEIEAIGNSVKAIEEAIAGRMSRGEPIPPPIDEKRGKGPIAEVSALTFLKSSLYMHCKERHVTRAELARLLSWHREQVDRLFRLDHNSRLDQMEAAYKAIGVALEFKIDFPAAA